MQKENIIRESKERINQFSERLLKIMWKSKPEITTEKAHAYPSSLLHTWKNCNEKILRFDSIDTKKPSRLYVQIPWCKSRCKYCRYPEIICMPGNNVVEEYLNFIEKELNIYCKKLGLKKIKIETLYLGGGTPSILTSKQLIFLFNILNKKISFIKNANKIIEISPSTLTEKKVKVLVKNKFNRVSMGVQTLNKDVLKQCNRIYDDKKASKKAYSLLRKYKIPEINIDLMLGLPDQSYEIFLEDLKEITTWKPSSISFLDMEIWPGSPMFEKTSKDSYRHWKKTLVMTAMYQDVMEKEHYISTRPHYYVRLDEMKHPSTRVPYMDNRIEGFQIGLGSRAISHLGKIIVRNHEINNYFGLLKSDKLPIKTYFRLTKNAFYAMKAIKSLCDSKIIPKYLEKHYEKQISFFIKNGFLNKNNRITRDGSLFGTEMMYMLYPQNI